MHGADPVDIATFDALSSMMASNRVKNIITETLMEMPAPDQLARDTIEQRWMACMS